MRIAEALESSGFQRLYDVEHFAKRGLICEVCFDGCKDTVHKLNQVVLRQGFVGVPVEIILGRFVGV